MTKRHFFSWVVISILSVAVNPFLRSASDTEEKPLSAVEAREKLDQRVFVELTVQAVKNRLEKRGEIYLDSEEDFHDPKNLAVVINREGAAEYHRKGIEDPAEHFREKKIRVRGTVTVKDEIRRIEISDPKQIELVKEE